MPAAASSSLEDHTFQALQETLHGRGSHETSHHLQACMLTDSTDTLKPLPRHLQLSAAVPAGHCPTPNSQIAHLRKPARCWVCYRSAGPLLSLHLGSGCLGARGGCPTTSQ